MRSPVPDSPRASVLARVHYDDFTGCGRASQQHARHEELPESYIQLVLFDLFTTRPENERSVFCLFGFFFFFVCASNHIFQGN